MDVLNKYTIRSMRAPWNREGNDWSPPTELWLWIAQCPIHGEVVVSNAWYVSYNELLYHYLEKHHPIYSQILRD